MTDQFRDREDRSRFELDVEGNDRLRHLPQVA